MDRRLIAICIVAGWMTATACGDDDDGGDDGGSAGSGGFGTSGRSGTSGTSGSGTSGTSGRGMNPAGCPTAAPADNSMCTMTGLDCAYGMMECNCEMGRGAGGMLLWDCSTPMMMQMCPAAEPMNGAACTSGPGDCMYGTRICDCPGDTDMWACWDPADCPATMPAEDSTCMPVGMECEYGMGQDGVDCDCETTGWDCGIQACPATEPAAGGMCDEGDGMCTFGDRVCECDNDMWICWAPSDCPATAPVNESTCPLEGMVCEYDGGECDCDGPDGWDCDDGVGSEPDGGI